MENEHRSVKISKKGYKKLILLKKKFGVTIIHLMDSAIDRYYENCKDIECI